MGRPARIIPAAAIALAALVLGAVAAWPRVSSRGYYADGAGTIHDPSGGARPRTVLWQPPTAEAALNTAGDDYEPRVSADGRTMYFVRGRAGHNAEIYLSRRTPAGWSEPEPLPFNSGSDELGPEPLRDGSGLLFYSNREGGRGGYDLWIAQRDGDGWRDPVNLGDAVNTAFNEYSPALTPDGGTLYFASNRPRPGEPIERSGPPWPATVREGLSAHDYDLYEAPFASGTPGQPRPMTALNTPANEGTPAVSPAGDFLYFSSDRAGGRGGFDLYRAWLRGGEPGAPANLGEPVNSAANDLDPALSIAGFGLEFSSDRPPDAGAERPGDYNLFHTESREVFLEREPRRIDWASVRSAVMPWLLGLLLLLMLLALLRFGRDILRNKRLSTLTKCLIVSVIAHGLLVILMSLWGVTNSIGELFKKPGGGSRVQLSSASGSGGGLALQIRGNLATPAESSMRTAELETPALAITRVAPSVSPPRLSPVDVRPSAAIGQTIADATPREETPSVRVADPAARDVSVLAPEAPAAASASEAAPASPRMREAGPDSRVPTGATPRVESPTLASSDVRAQPVVRETSTGANPSGPAPEVRLNEPQGSAPLALIGTPRSASPAPAATEQTPRIEAGSAGPLSAPAPSGSAAPAIGAAVSPGPARVADGRVDLRIAVPDAPGASGPSQAAPAEPGASLSVALPGPAETAPPMAGAPEVSAPGPVAAVASPSVPVASGSPSTTGTASGTPRLGAASLPAAPAAALGVPNLQAAPGLPGMSLSLNEPATADRAASGFDLALPKEQSAAADSPARAGGEAKAGGPSPGTWSSSSPLSLGLKSSTTDGPAVRFKGPAARADGPALDLGAREEPERITLAPLNVAPPGQRATDLRLPAEVAPAEDQYAQRAPEVREKVLEQRGGDQETEAAVNRALSWLAKHQSRSGKWDSKDFDDRCGECSGAATVDADVATTSLALLCFFGGDHTHLRDGPYRENVTRGLEWLLRRQSDSGDLRGGESMYTHAIATIALAEAYGMTHDARLAEPVRKAVAFIADARSPKGGWRYEPGQFGDTSVLGWQVMAMVSARRAGIPVAQAELDAARDWLDSVSPKPGVYSYQPSDAPTSSMTAEGWFCRQLLGDPRDSARAAASREFLREVTPKWGRRSTTYLWYYGTLAYFQHGGEEWDRWNAAVKKQLVDHQERDGAAAGSWDPLDRWAVSGGRVYQTAICTLTLEVYYRYLPMYASGAPAAAER